MDIVLLPIKLALLIMFISFFIGLPISLKYGFFEKPKGLLYKILMLLSNISMALFILGFIFIYLEGKYGCFR